MRSAICCQPMEHSSALPAGTKGNLSYITVLQQGNGTEKRGLVIEHGGADLHLSPRTPGIAGEVFANVAEDEVPASQNSSAVQEQIWIKAVDGGHSKGGPDIEAMLANFPSDLVSTF